MKDNEESPETLKQNKQKNKNKNLMANKILQWNIRGTKINFEEIILLIKTFCPAIICLQETHLKENDTINIKHYSSYNYINKKSNIATGGSSLYINKNIPHSKINLKTNMQAVAITATLHKEITFCSLYISPNETMDEKELNALIQQLPKPFILMGDFNSHNELWGSKKNNKRGRIIETILNENHLCLLNNKENTYLHPATGTLSAIDLTICDPTVYMDYSWRTHDDTCGSDHFPIILENENPKLDDKIPCWNLQKANWEKFQNSCQYRLIPEANTDTEEHIAYFTNTLLTIAKENVPKSSTSSKFNKPWFNKECQKAVRKRRANLRKFKKNPTKENLDIYKNSRAKARKIIKESKRNTWKNYVSKINVNTKTKKVWEMVRKISGKNNKDPIKHLICNNIKITNKENIANKLAEQFSTNSSSKNQNKKFQIIKQNEEKKKINFKSKNEEKYNQPFNRTELKEAIHKSHDTAVGPDEIHYQFLKNLPKPSLNYLLQIYNEIWRNNSIPKNWKQAIVIPIPKPQKDHTDPINYRPITLTSCLCKTFERMVNERLSWYLETKHLITKYQSGFRKSRSPIDHLIRLETLVREAFVRKEHLIAIFFDIEKAYDTTWKYGIKRDLHELGLKGRMPEFICNFLNDRYFQVRMGNILSVPKEQEMGVPQGSILSVTLFNIKINNIIKNVNTGIDCALYVDDLFICYRSKYVPTAERKLQLCINKINKWAIENGFKFSKDKTKCIHFCKLRKIHHDPILKLDQNNIPVVDQHKYLGIIYDKKLSFIPHIKYLKTKCHKAMQLIKVLAHTDWGADKTTLLKLYRSLVRSKLDYGCYIYGAARKSYIKELNAVHHQGLRLALGAFKTSPVDSLYTEANEPPLTLRRKKLALQYYLKLSSCPSNPAYQCVFHPQYAKLFNERENTIEPYSLRIKKTLTEAQIDTTKIHESIKSKSPPWMIKQPSIILKLSKHSKTKTHPSTFHEELLNIQNTYKEHLQIYTDGSKDGDRVGCAAIHKKIKLKKRLPDGASVYSAEVSAIDLALNIIASQEHKKYLILTDSLSVLISIKEKK